MARFDPIFPSHAIERCAASVLFEPAVPEKVFSRILDRNRERLAEAQFVEHKAKGFEIDVTAGRLSSLAGGVPTTFVLPDGHASLVIAPNAVTWRLLRYVKWDAFRRDFAENVQPVLAAFTEVVSTTGVKLEYWDRFLWRGTWEDFDINLLINTISGFVAQKAASSKQQWHSHCGWFEFPTSGVRKLVNVNVDMQEAQVPGALAAVPSAAIYTMVTDQIYTRRDDQPISKSIFEEVPPVNRLDEQHGQLKAMLAEILLPDMSKRIGLVTSDAS